jgi:hypothetical protein
MDHESTVAKIRTLVRLDYQHRGIRQSKSTHCWVLFAFLIFASKVQLSIQQPCFKTAYPRLMGGVSGDSQFTTMDFKPGSSGDIVVGGRTSDVAITSSTVASEMPIPIAAYIRQGGPYLWKKFFYTGIPGIGREFISAIKFLQSDGSKIVAAFSSPETGAKNANLLLATLNPADGTIINTYSYSPALPAYSNPRVKPDGLLYEGPTEDFYVAG